MSSSRRLNPYEFIQGGCSSESPRPRFTLPRHPSEVTVGCHAQPLTRCSRADLLRQESLPRDVCAAQAPSRTLWMMLGSWSGRRDSIWGSGDAARRRPLHMWARLTCGPLEGRLHAFNLCRELSISEQASCHRHRSTNRSEPDADGLAIPCSLSFVCCSSGRRRP